MYASTSADGPLIVLDCKDMWMVYSICSTGVHIKNIMHADTYTLMQSQTVTPRTHTSWMYTCRLTECMYASQATLNLGMS